jgi:6,7-dimethyl-8-ribityllumazine synthase
MKTGKQKGGTVKTKARVLIVEANYYDAITDALSAGAQAALKRAGAAWDRVTITGALEIPGAIAMAAAAKRYDAYVALGCVLKGETIHYEIVGFECARGLMDLTLAGHCIGNGVVTCENEQQAWARARANELDVGGSAAEAALALLRHKRGMKKAKAL